jgi:hypothetical protein
MYEIDGQTFVQGQKHEALLERGMSCEIFIEVCVPQLLFSYLDCYVMLFPTA